MKRYYYVTINHVKDNEVKAIFVDASTLEYDDYCVFIRDFLDKNSNFAKVHNISKISSLQYLKNNQWSVKVALKCLPDMLELKKKERKKEALKKLFSFAR